MLLPHSNGLKTDDLSLLILVHQTSSLTPLSLPPSAVFTYIFIADSDHEVATLKVDFSDPRPVVMRHRGLVAENDDAAWRKAQEVLHAVFTLDARDESVIKLIFGKAEHGD